MSMESTGSAPAARESRKSLLKSYAQQALIGGLVGGVLGAPLLPHVEDFDTMARRQTAQERTLDHAIESSLTHKKVWVDCTTRLPGNPISPVPTLYAYTNKKIPFTSAAGFMPVIHYPQKGCDRLTVFTEDIKSRGSAYTLTHTSPITALDMLNLTHEAEHIGLESDDEARVHCAAVQRVTQLSKALGANEALQKAIFATAVYYYGRASDPADYISPECRDGGAYDLDPAHSGNDFPR